MPDAINSPLASNGVDSGDIDVHVHVHLWTNDFARYPLIPPFTPEQILPPTFEPADLFAVARPVGVQRAVLVQIVWYGFHNSYMLECIRQYPGVFSGVALIEEHGDAPAATLRRLIPLGVRGVRIVPPFHRGRTRQALERRQGRGSLRPPCSGKSVRQGKGSLGGSMPRSACRLRVGLCGSRCLISA